MSTSSAKIAEPAPAVAIDSAPTRSQSFGGLRQWCVRVGLRLMMVAYGGAMTIAKWIGPRSRANRPMREILLTGTFYSDNWILAHVRPMALSGRCRRVRMVAIHPMPSIPGVEAIYPPKWLRRLIGGVPSRLLVFVWTAVRTRPDYVGGFHLLVNGLVAALVGRVVGARSIYFCVGGPREVNDGGIHADNRLFGLLKTPDPWIEEQLIRAVGRFDLVVTMGTGAVTFYRGHGLKNEFQVVSGGIDSDGYQLPAEPRTIDLILVGRLARIKRIDIFLRAVRIVAEEMPSVRAVVVGDGEVRESLEALAEELDLGEHVRFAGYQQDVAGWLNKSRVSCLTSDSEGLALSVMEAMMAGVPCIVSDVGDLGDVVVDGVNGFLVDSRDPADFAAAMLKLIGDEDRWRLFAEAAKRSGLEHDVPSVTRQWDGIFSEGR